MEPCGKASCKSKWSSGAGQMVYSVAVDIHLRFRMDVDKYTPCCEQMTSKRMVCDKKFLWKVCMRMHIINI